MDMGEKMAERLPVFVGVLPDAATQTWQKLLTLFAVEARFTFAQFRTSLAGDLQRHTGAIPCCNLRLCDGDTKSGRRLSSGCTLRPQPRHSTG